MTPETVSVIGLGKLGSPMLACFASKGYFVVGADADAAKVAAINRGEAPVQETGLPELLAANRERIRATQNVTEAIAESALSFIIVPTPSKADGEFSLDFVLTACRDIGRALKDKPDFHIVVLTSTVMPGATDGPVRQALERESGKRAGVDFGLCYSPEFIALGNVIHDMLYADFILIGESDPRSGEALAALYKRTCENDPPIALMNAINAEITKISVNTYVTTKISYANMLSEICQSLPGGDVDVVTGALGLDTRIGRKYLKGATGYGGPCFPRDNLAFSKLAHNQGLRARIAEATDEVNRAQVPRLAALIREHLPAGGRVGILGLSYKPSTDVTTESQGVQLAALLAEAGVSVSVYDPAGMDSARSALLGQVTYAATASECAATADVVVIATPWDEFKQIAPDVMERAGRPRVLVDCWRLLKDRYGAGVTYVALGVGPPAPSSAITAGGDQS